MLSFCRLDCHLIDQIGIMPMINHLRRIWGCIANILAPVLSCILFILVLTSLYVVFCDAQWLIHILAMEDGIEPSPKFVALEFLGAVMGGIVIALLAATAYRRAKAMEAAVDKTEQGQQQERLKNAIEHLSNKKESVRLGAAYELFHLAEDVVKFRQTVLDIICGHIRVITRGIKYQKKYKARPSEEIQNMMRLFFTQEKVSNVDGRRIFEGCSIKLRGSWLNGIDLVDGHLEEADLTKAHLMGAQLTNTHMQGVYLTDTKLQGADLSYAQMQGADLVNTRLWAANLSSASMQGTYLGKAQLQGVCLRNVKMQGACNKVISSKFKDRVEERQNEWTNLELEEPQDEVKPVIFSGGLCEDDVKCVGKYMKADDTLKDKLQRHIKAPVYKLPKNKEIKIGKYTEEESKEWLCSSI